MIPDKDLIVSRADKTPPSFETAVRLTEILNSEPATEAALLRQAANDIGDYEGEIVTAHARPVARPLDGVREAARRAFAVRLGLRDIDWLALFKSERARSVGRRVHDTVAAGAARFAAASRRVAALIAAWARASRTVWQAAMEQVRAKAS